MKYSEQDISNLFLVDLHEASLLFSLHNIITTQDIENSPPDLAKKKSFWLEKYLELTSLDKSITSPTIDNHLSKEEVVVGLSKLPREKRVIILFEAILFRPYFDLNIRHENLTGLKKDSFGSSEIERMRNLIFQIAEKTEVSGDKVVSLIRTAEAAYSDSLKAIGDDNTLLKKLAVIGFLAVAVAMTAGWAAPAIGGFIGTLMGLSGAAATSAGLAFLGGGALAVGGAGMAGGAALIIGGGAVIGIMGGAALSSGLIQFHASIILSQLAKAEVIITKVIGDAEAAKHMIEIAVKQYVQHAKNCEQTIAAIKKEILTLSEDKRENEENKLKEVIKSEKYFRNALARLRKYKAEVLDFK